MQKFQLKINIYFCRKPNISLPKFNEVLEFKLNSIFLLGHIKTKLIIEFIKYKIIDDWARRGSVKGVMNYLKSTKLLLFFLLKGILGQNEVLVTNETDIILCARSFKTLNKDPDYTTNCFLDDLNLHPADAIQFMILGPLAIVFWLILIFLFHR